MLLEDMVDKHHSFICKDLFESLELAEMLLLIALLVQRPYNGLIFALTIAR